ncbi:MAG: repressor LexA [Oligoflexales bacterium]|nr:repressor LexA [Oligoflexales bacterium]
MEKLTPKQEKAFEYIKTQSVIKGASPTLREICEYMGYSAVGSAQDLVAVLHRKGLIDSSGKRKARAFVLTQKGRDYGVSAHLSHDEAYTIPCLGIVPAGNPLEAIEERIGSLKLSPSFFPFNKAMLKRLFGLRVHGASMVNAGILDGDLLVVHSQKEANPGDIVVARVGGEATVKRLMKDLNGWFLKPENDNFSIIRAEDQPFDIIGKVIALQRSL